MYSLLPSQGRKTSEKEGNNICIRVVKTAQVL